MNYRYIIYIILLLIRFSGGKQKTQQEYLLADKTASVLPVAFSLMASFMSAITLLGVTMENYTHGTQFVLINLSYLLSTPVAAYLFLPVFHNLQSASVYRWVQLLLLPPLPPHNAMTEGTWRPGLAPPPGCWPR